MVEEESHDGMQRIFGSVEYRHTRRHSTADPHIKGHGIRHLGLRNSNIPGRVRSRAEQVVQACKGNAGRSSVRQGWLQIVYRSQLKRWVAVGSWTRELFPWLMFKR